MGWLNPAVVRILLLVWAALCLSAGLLARRAALRLEAANQARQREISGSRRQLAALHGVWQALSFAPDLSATLDAVCGQAASALRAGRVAVALRDRPDEPESLRATYGWRSPIPTDLALLALPRTTCVTAAIPGPDGTVLGTLYVLGRSDGSDTPFSAGEENLLRAIAAQAGSALTNSFQFERLRRRSSLLQEVAERVSGAIGDSFDPPRLAGLLAEQALKMVSGDGAGVWLLADDGQTLRPAASCLSTGENRDGLRRAGAFYRNAHSRQAIPFLSRVLEAAGPLVVEDTAAAGEPGAWAAEAGMRSVVAVPLRGPGRTGLLLLHWSGLPLRLDKDDLALVSALADVGSLGLAASHPDAASPKSRPRLEDLARAAERLGESLDAGFSPPQAAELIVTQAQQLAGCPLAVLSVRDEGRTLQPLAAADPRGPTGVDRAPAWRFADFPFLERVLDRGTAVLIADVAHDLRLTERERAALQAADLSALVLVPLRGRDGRVSGLLSLFWTPAAPAPAPEQALLAQTLASVAAFALENARLGEESRRAETQRSEQIAEATAARDFLAQILQNVPAAVLVFGADEERAILSANALAEAMPDPDRRQDGLVGRCLADVFPGIDGLLQAALAQAARGETVTLTDVAYDGFARGTTDWLMTLMPLRDPRSRHVAQLALLALETTDRLRLQRENDRYAREQQHRAAEWEATLRSLGDGVVLCDLSGEIVSMNRAALAILAQDRSAVGRPVDDWAVGIDLRYPSGQPVPPGAVPLTRALQTGRTCEREEFLIRTGEGLVRVVEVTAAPVLTRDAAGSGGAVAVLRDVTDLKESRRQEEESSRRVEDLLDISRRLNATRDVGEIHRIVVEGARVLLRDVPHGRALLYAFEGEGKPLVLLASEPEERARRPRSLREAGPLSLPFNAASPLIWQVYLSRRPAVSGDVASDPLFAAEADRALLRGAGPAGELPRSALVLPLLAGDAVSGHLIVTSSAAGQFEGSGLVDALSSLAALAVIARVNARLYEQMKQKADELDALWTVGQAIASNLDFDEGVDTLTDRVCAVLQAELCTLTLFETTPSGRRALRLQGTRHRDASLTHEDGGEPDLCDRAGTEAATTGQPATLVGVPNPPLDACRWRAFAGRSGLHSVLAVPLCSGAEALGALTVYVAGARPFSPEQVKLLSALGSLAVALVRNARASATG